MRLDKRLYGLALIALLCAPMALADEGMWTFNNFPSDKVKAKYGFAPDQAWLDHVRLGSVRIAGGCSASLVSPDGLVMTNHHCSHSCIEELSTKKRDYVKNGFYAKELADEPKCPSMEVDQLIGIEDVTKQVQGATQGAPDAKFFDLQKAKIAELEKACAGGSDEVRCEVVSLYRGGRFDLYRYRRFQDVRLVFAPEFQIAFFGGDPDNFMFPRYDLDVSFVRLYGEDGKPVQTPDYLGWAADDARAGDLTFVVGNPGGTSRLMTVAQLELQRDVALPFSIARLSEARGLLTEYQRRGAEQKRHSNATLFYVENGVKAYKGRHAALAQKRFMDAKQASESAFKNKVNADPALKKLYGGAWAGIEAATAKQREHFKAYGALERGLRLSDEFGIARTLLRAADELPKPNGERLAEFADSRLPQLKQNLFSKAPIYDEFEIAMLTFGLTKMREDLGPDHPVIRQVFGDRSPEEIAAKAVKGTKLKSVKLREALFAGGKARIDASEDPMIALARALDPAAREIRKRMEDEVDGPLKKYGELLAKATFAVYGTSIYPDATFTPRVSYGTIRGWKEDGRDVAPVTYFSGAFDRATGRDPFALPERWLDAKARLDLDTPFDICTDNDIIGGNSGSPVVNKAGEIVGLVFDGNLPSLGGEYGFDDSDNRTVAVHGAALIEALEKIYGAKRIVEELRPKKR
jgi:hypothetical protein